MSALKKNARDFFDHLSRGSQQMLGNLGRLIRQKMGFLPPLEQITLSSRISDLMEITIGPSVRVFVAGLNHAGKPVWWAVDGSQRVIDNLRNHRNRDAWFAMIAHNCFRAGQYWWDFELVDLREVTQAEWRSWFERDWSIAPGEIAQAVDRIRTGANTRTQPDSRFSHIGLSHNPRPKYQPATSNAA